MRSIELIELLQLLFLMFSVGHRPPIYTVLCIIYGRISTAVGCLSDVNSLYGRIHFNTYESYYSKSVRDVPTIAVIPTFSTVAMGLLFFGGYQNLNRFDFQRRGRCSWLFQ